VKRPNFRFAESAADRFLSAHLSNAEYNRLVWGLYPYLWRLGSLAGVTKPREDTSGEILGEEWGSRAWVREVLDLFVFPYVSEESVVAEIGVGGGRIATQVAPRVATFYGLDVSSGMLDKAKQALAEVDNARFLKLKGPLCPPELHGRVDFVYAFDVLVHFDLHLTWKYIQLMHEMAKPGGKALVHVANLKSPLGWERFSKQKAFSVGGLYWQCPELVAVMADRAGFQIVVESTPDPRNEYLGRDHLAVLAKVPSG
jgi:SAM-dependent methyltransferase